MSKQDQDKSYFVAFCIEQYKVAKGMSGTDVAPRRSGIMADDVNSLI